MKMTFFLGYASSSGPVTDKNIY